MLKSVNNRIHKIFNLFLILCITTLSLPYLFGGSYVYAEDNQTGGSPSDVINLKNALDTDQALPPQILGKCRFNTESGAANGANTAAQGQKNKDTLLACMDNIIQLMFIITVVITIIKVAAAQLGIVAFGGEDSTQGGSVVATRKTITEGLIGMALIGGSMLILQLFNTSFNEALNKLFGL